MLVTAVGRKSAVSIYWGKYDFCDRNKCSILELHSSALHKLGLLLRRSKAPQVLRSGTQTCHRFLNKSPANHCVLFDRHVGLVCRDADIEIVVAILLIRLHGLGN